MQPQFRLDFTGLGRYKNYTSFNFSLQAFFKKIGTFHIIIAEKL